jgi:hypothetical protein
LAKYGSIRLIDFDELREVMEAGGFDIWPEFELEAIREGRKIELGRLPEAGLDEDEKSLDVYTDGRYVCVREMIRGNKGFTYKSDAPDAEHDIQRLDRFFEITEPQRG